VGTRRRNWTFRSVRRASLTKTSTRRSASNRAVERASRFFGLRSFYASISGDSELGCLAPIDHSLSDCSFANCPDLHSRWCCADAGQGPLVPDCRDGLAAGWNSLNLRRVETISPHVTFLRHFFLSFLSNFTHTQLLARWYSNCNSSRCNSTHPMLELKLSDVRTRWLC